MDAHEDNIAEELILKTFQDVNKILKAENNVGKKYYRRQKRLVVLSNKLLNAIKNEELVYFSKNEIKIMEVYYHIYQNVINTVTDKMTQIVYDYIVEYLDKQKNQVLCLCETEECCRKCCVHPETTCVWKNYVEANEWNDPDNVYFQNFMFLGFSPCYS